MRATFTVVYRTGGRARCLWLRCLPVSTRTEAEIMRVEVEHAGRKALVFETTQLDRLGMPEGWDAKEISL
jgi:predicted nuclease of predicted toxin-antitoxin system